MPESINFNYHKQKKNLIRISQPRSVINVEENTSTLIYPIADIS